MAYNNYYQQPAGGQREYAIDWEAKSIPLLAYKNCLVANESFLLALRKVPDYHPATAKARLMAAIVTFFNTVETGFAKYLRSEEYIQAPEKYDNQNVTVTDYEKLMLVEAANVTSQYLLLLFRILKNWCFEHGPFQTFSMQEDDVFKNIEEDDS